MQSIFHPFSTIRAQLGLTFAFVLLLVTALGIFSLQQLYTVNTVAVEMVEVWWPKARAINDIRQSATSHRLLATRRLEMRNFRQLAKVESGLQNIEQKIVEDRATFEVMCENGPDHNYSIEEDLLGAFYSNWRQYLSSFDSVKAQLEGGELDAAHATFKNETLSLLDTAFQNLDRLVAHLDTERSGGEGQIAQTRKHAETMIFLAITTTVILVIWTTLWTRRRISTPLRDVTEVMERLTKGEEDIVEIPGASRVDEIGVLASATQGYRDSLIKTREIADQLEIERNEAMVLRNAAIEANNAKSMLLANVSHELRTPMNAICGFSDVMVSEVFGPVHPPRYAEYVEGIHNSARLLLNNIEDLLDVSSLEVDKFGWRTLEFNPVEAVERAVSMSRASAPTRQVDLSIKLSQDKAATIQGDPERLGQAIINLVGNAIKFSHDEAAVGVTIEETDHAQIAIRVEDKGCGIAPENIDSILKPFAQVNANRYHATEGGLGLGLAITREIIRRFDGELRIDSQLEEGTTFSILLPCRLSNTLAQGEAA